MKPEHLGDPMRQTVLSILVFALILTPTGCAGGAGSQETVEMPGITSLNPTSGPVGTSVTITGANFGASQGTSTVAFNGTAATPTNWSATSIVAPVPAGAGPIRSLKKP